MFYNNNGVIGGNVVGRPVYNTIDQVLNPRFQQGQAPQTQVQPAQQPPEAQLPRALNYYADYSGCGFWRMLWPEQLLNAYQKVTVHGTTVMVLDPRYYGGIKAVRIQRQATPHQKEFVKWLRQLADQNKFRLIYEIDDICFREDIPDYNKFKFAFTADEIRQSAMEIMQMCDEMTVTCDFMKDYYAEKTGHQSISVIPNFIPRFWMDRYYNRKNIENNFRKNIKKPRILYAGSGAHFDVDNKTGQKDDFAHVIQAVAKTHKEFQWVFVGAYPLPLQQFVQQGLIEFHPWCALYDYPAKVASLNVQAMVAPLIDNTFNRAKSDLKHIEACAYGLPIACQDIVTYSKADFKFTTGDEMIDILKGFFKGTGHYMNLSDRARTISDGRWLEDNIDCYSELYTLPFGSAERKNLNKFNGLA